MVTTLPRAEQPADPEVGEPEELDRGAFGRWSLVTYLGVVAVLTAAILVWLDGHLVYVLDDAAIHLSIGDRLAHDGTWGVAPGHFESASSSPLWTVLVAGALLVAGPAAQWVPLVLNVAAGVGVVWMLARHQAVIEPARRRPIDAAVTVLLVTVVLFLPGLALVGMEHTLHVALVLAVVAVVHRWALDRPAPSLAVACALLALATLTRFETAFVAAGLATALIVVDRRAHLRRAVALSAASGVPIVAFGLANRALGGGWLPNSILAKGQATGQSSSDGTGPVDIHNRLMEDPLLLLLVAMAVIYLLLRGRRSTAAVPAIALVVAAPVHAALADVGWYDRYQAYLIAIGVYVLLAVLAEVPAPLRRRAMVAVCALALLGGATKANLHVKAPLAADDMYRQQYQAGLFVDRYYDGQPIATDQLGYISYFHGGPITDFAGLGDREVLEAPDDESHSELWPRLAAERGFRVAVLYDKAAAFRVPREWVRAGEWRISTEPITGVSQRLQFFATVPEEVGPLQDHLRDFEDDLPARTTLRINENAGLQAMAIAARSSDDPDTGGSPDTDAT